MNRVSVSQQPLDADAEVVESAALTGAWHRRTFAVIRTSIDRDLGASVAWLRQRSLPGAVSDIASILGTLIAGAALLTMVGLITLNVITRKLFGHQINGVDEISGLLLVVIVFMPAADVMRRREHIQVDLVQERLPRWLRRACRLATLAFGVAILSVFVWQVLEFQRTSAFLNERTAVLLIPFTDFTPFILAGYALFGVAIVTVGCRLVIDWLTPGIEEGGTLVSTQSSDPRSG